ncbi:MAG: rod shape-determining protein MreC [Caulobacterales bacterium]
MARRRNARRSGGGRLTIGAVTAVALIAVGGGLLALRNAETGQLGVEPTADDALGGVIRILGAPGRGLADGLDRLGQMWTATDRVKQLERENAELRAWRGLALALAERNERYEQLLKMPAASMGGALTPNAGVAARLVLDAGGPFRRTLLANAGADLGVKRGYIAVNENGLVGRVVSVGASTARVLLLDDYNARVPVMGQTSRVRAIMVGEPGGSAPLEGMLHLTQPKLGPIVAAGSTLREGEAVVTSGDGGVFPGGLLVGYARRDNASQWRVDLAVAKSGIDMVRIIPFAQPTPPEAAPVNDAGPPPPPPSAREIAAGSGVALAPPPPVRLLPSAQVRAPAARAPPPPPNADDEVDGAPAADDTPAAPPPAPAPARPPGAPPG